jgi:hypothetical protein
MFLVHCFYYTIILTCIILIPTQLYLMVVYPLSVNNRRNLQHNN